MNFLVFAAVFVVLFIVCIIYISLRWKWYTGGLFPMITSLRRYNILSRMWPCDDGFLSLKFSALRHTVLPLAVSAIIWFINIGWLNSILLSLSAMYALVPLFRNRVRSREYKVETDTVREVLKPVLTACHSVTALSIANYIVLMISYGLRP